MSIPQKLAWFCCRASWAKFLLLCQANYPQISDPSLCWAFRFVLFPRQPLRSEASHRQTLTQEQRKDKKRQVVMIVVRLKDDDNCTPQVRRGVGLPNSVRIRRSRYYLQCASNEHVRNPSKLSIDRSIERERERERERDCIAEEHIITWVVKNGEKKRSTCLRGDDDRRGVCYERTQEAGEIDHVLCVFRILLSPSSRLL
jgi:hypothetical protein